MNTTYTAADLTAAVEDAINAGDASQTEFDVAGIVADLHAAADAAGIDRYTPAPGFDVIRDGHPVMAAVDHDEFWTIVEAHALYGVTLHIDQAGAFDVLRVHDGGTDATNPDIDVVEDADGNVLSLDVVIQVEPSEAPGPYIAALAAAGFTVAETGDRPGVIDQWQVIRTPAN